MTFKDICMGGPKMQSLPHSLVHPRKSLNRPASDIVFIKTFLLI